MMQILLWFNFLLSGNILTGASQVPDYVHLLEGRKVAVVANHTSVIDNTHLVDSLLSLHVGITRILSPEHGFRGTAEAGETIKNGIDQNTGLPVISLYGNHKKPTAGDLKGVDVVVFDIQDVGARFYTYISTLHYVMEACAENRIPVIILDRPNPNGHYIDGPVMEPKHKSFIGMHPVPVVHGMTIGEYALMTNGEGWLNKKVKCDITVIPCKNYTHKSRYELAIAPSPNLQEMKAIYLYPSVCFFEGTSFSLGRGTDFPFMVYGHPELRNCDFHFTPRSIPGVSNNPPLLGKNCCGVDLRTYSDDELFRMSCLNLEWLISAYRNFPGKDKFFIPFFEKLAGTTKLREQIEQGLSADEIRKSWQAGLSQYDGMRKKYLLYSE